MKYLREYAGDNCDIATELLIGEIGYKIVKLRLYQMNMLESREEAAHYLPMSNSVRLDLKELREVVGKQQAPDLREFLSDD
jgi:hypothetical protein